MNGVLILFWRFVKHYTTMCCIFFPIRDSNCRRLEISGGGGIYIIPREKNKTKKRPSSKKRGKKGKRKHTQIMLILIMYTVLSYPVHFHKAKCSTPPRYWSQREREIYYSIVKQDQKRIWPITIAWSFDDNQLFSDRYRRRIYKPNSCYTLG